MNDGYVNGYIQRDRNAAYRGEITIDGVALEGGIEATYFKQKEKHFLWLKRKPVMEYDQDMQSYKTRPREPQWEAYLEKQIDGKTVAYKGVFTFLRFRYSIVGVWDNILGKDKMRLNLFVERLPMQQQTIINKTKSWKTREGK